MTPDKRTFIALTVSTLLLAACELPFLGDEAAKAEARREAEGKAIGSACRHAGRALEECYERSPRVSKAAIFSGWRDMDGYMRENNIQVVSPDIGEQPAAAAPKVGSAEDAPKAAPADEKPKAAAAEQKPKAAELPPGKKAAEAAPGTKAPGPKTVNQNAIVPLRPPLRRIT